MPPLDALAEQIERWKIDFERFLAGARQLPPDELQARIARELRELRGANLRSAADQFRLSALEARFNSYHELNNRRLRDREEGRGARQAPAAAPAAERRLDPMTGIVITDRIEEAALDALYAGLARQQSGTPTMDRATFRGYIARQIELIRVKTGCESVQFRLAAEEGKLKLKAKPVGV